MFGFLKKRRKQESGDFIDVGRIKKLNEEINLKASDATSTEAGSGSQKQSQADDNGFLSTFANTASTTPTASTLTSEDDKVVRLVNKIDSILERMDLLEHKIERLERRIDIKY